MKIKITFIAALMAFASVVKTEAQTIPNAGFENWTNFGAYSDPTGWSSTNMSTAWSGVFTTEQGTPGSAGASFLKLTVKNISSLSPAFAVSKPVMPMGGIAPGFPVNSRPADFTGKWQYKSTGQDTMVVQVIFTKWNTTTMTSDMIGIGYDFVVGSTLTSWTNFSIPVFYMDGTVPDSAVIYLIAGAVNNQSNLVANDYLYIDELAFSGIVAGVDELQNAVKMGLAPNPFSTYTTVTFSEEQKNATITLLNILGKEVRSFVFTGTQLTLERDELPSGVYFLNANDGKNSLTKKIVIQ